MRRALTGSAAPWVSLVAVVVLVLLDLRVPDTCAAALGYRGQLGMFALDMNLWPPLTTALLAEYGLAGRGAMILTHLTLDMLLPFAYAVLLFNVIRRAARRLDLSPLLRVAPIGAAVADIIENLCFVALALLYPSSPDALVWAAAVATWTKFLLFGLSVGCALALGCATILHRVGRLPRTWAPKTAVGVVSWLAALALIGVLLLGTDVEAAAPPPPEPDCMALLTVGLRGNGDPLTSDAGMGGDTRAVVVGISRRLPGIKAAGVAFPYVTGTPPQIVAHIRAGSRMLVAYLAERGRRCPAERVVLVGQSEGAAIVHLALPAVGGQLAAAVLLADPARLAGAPYDSLASTNDGILAWALMSGRADDLPASIEPMVRSYCLATDPVCDPSPATELRGMRDNIHTAYRHDPIAERAADFVASRVAPSRG